MLPVLDGYEVCKKLRGEGDNTPILMLTVKDKEIDKVLGLELGADDYVTKPFSLRELVSRVKAILRRTEERSNEVTHYRIGEIELDLLIQKKDKVLTRDDFLNEIWGEDNLVVSYRTIDSHIANIRKKIEDNPSDPKYILSIRGVGYKLSG
jgi:DNA-binding response OmpR family regulator